MRSVDPITGSLDPLLSSAGMLIRAIRRGRRLSQRELAALSGLPSSTVARIEAGVTDPKFGTMARLLRATGYEVMVSDARGRILTLDGANERLVDRARRQFPAHLRWGETGSFDSGPWWGWHHIGWHEGDPPIPPYTYWRRRAAPLRFGENPCSRSMRVWDDAT